MRIELQNIRAGYGRGDVLHGISLTIEGGERVAILGANGSGKTTLLRTMTGILPYQGEIHLDGINLHTMKRKEIASRIAMMMQISQTYFSYTVEETVALGRYVQTEDRRSRDAAVEQYLKMTGLLEERNRPVSSLSGGQLQRVFLARTMAQETPVILLDEPTNHLDLKIQTELMEHMNQWAQESGHTLIGVYHDINLALSMADRLVVMKDGCILSDSPSDEILAGGVLEEAYGMDVRTYMKKQYEKWK